MKIVIDIDDEDYDDILNGETKASALNWSIFNAIRDGTPLPKGHGRLVDISPYEQKEAFATSWILTRKIGQIVKDEECVPLYVLPTVIEAESEEQ